MKTPMINKIKNCALLTVIIFTALFSFVPQISLAVDTTGAIQCGINSAASGDCNTQPSSSLDPTIKNIVNILSILVGVVAVIMIIIGGLRYVTSGGKQESVTAAKNTILYSIIGLVIAALAQVIVRFVLHNAVK